MTAMSLRRGIGSLLLAALAVSCSSSSTPQSPSPVIPTGGEKKSLNALVGRWEGTYTNPSNGRTGTIVLEFSSGGKEAHGDILMVPPSSTASVPSAEETLRTMPQVYEINFIDAAGSGLTGTVGPYEDPTFHCSAHSEFQGTLQGDTIVGTFRTECLGPQGQPDPNVPATTGTWSVSRKKV
jgi:hypothetical protein